MKRKNKVLDEKELERIKKSRFRLLCLLICIDVLLIVYLIFIMIKALSR